ncbi:MAG: ankyrin repeat protein, partial [Alteromonas naphthalenivorans]
MFDRLAEVVINMFIIRKGNTMKRVFLLLCLHVSMYAMDSRLDQALRLDRVDEFKAYLEGVNGDTASSEQEYEQELCQDFVKLGVNDCIPEIKKETFLHAAVSNNAFNIAQYLVYEEGAAVNVTNQQGFTPVAIAAHNGQEGMIELLLNHNANPSTPNQWGNGPLHIVA